MKKIIKLLSISSALLLIGCAFNNKNTTEDSIKSEVIISAAASLNGAITEIKSEFEKKHPNVELTLNFASSGSLEKQISEGAPCDVFISASEVNMDNLDKKGLILEDTNKILLKNRLVLIAPTNSTITSINDLTKDSIMHVAIGEPSSVPAGKYADETLTYLNLKDALNSKLVYGKDVKAVLAWVMNGNADGGFVYKSDVYDASNVKIIEEIPDEYHSPINYKIGVVKSSNNIEKAKLFEDYLYSDTAQKILQKYGYDTHI